MILKPQKLAKLKKQAQMKMMLLALAQQMKNGLIQLIRREKLLIVAKIAISRNIKFLNSVQINQIISNLT
jgi:hypothetical protein